MGKIFKESEDMKWASLVFPWLSPQSIASLALTCSFFRPLSKKINTLRIADAARGLENYPVPVSNTVDDILYPYFLYTSTSILSISSPKQQWGHETLADHLTSKPLISDSEILEGAGCNCIDCSKEEQECSCNELSVYADDGRICFSGGCSNSNFEGSEDNAEIGDLNPNSEGFEDNFEIEGLDGGPLVVMECGPACRCGEGCRNRVSQRSLSARVEIVRHLKKGWGLHVAEPVKRGAFVCEYAGEFLTTAEARERQRHYDEANLNKCNFCSALLVIREHLPSGQACLRLNIDATIIGWQRYDVSVGFVMMRRIECGQQFKIIGNLKELGNWDISKGLPMTYHKGDLWTASAKINNEGSNNINGVEYKVVVVEFDDEETEVCSIVKIPKNSDIDSIYFVHVI